MIPALDSGIPQANLHVADAHRYDLVGHEVQASALVAEKFDIALFGKFFHPRFLLEGMIVENGGRADGIGLSRLDRF